MVGSSCPGLVRPLVDDVRGSPAADRLRIRTARTTPLSGELHAWLQAPLARLPGRGELARAIRYSLSRWMRRR